MIPILLMLADAPPMTAIDAERAFAADAKTIGQWTAFTKWSTDDATMFVPQPTNAHAFLKERKNPPNAIDWWPTASWISCDGSLAVNTGGWERPDGSVGYFSTVWQRQPDGGWKWIVDGGDALKVARPRPAKPAVRVAECRPPRTAALDLGDSIDSKSTNPSGEGRSKDETLFWWWWVGPKGERTFTVSLYKAKPNGGAKLVTVLTDKIPAPK